VKHEKPLVFRKYTLGEHFGEVDWITIQDSPNWFSPQGVTGIPPLFGSTNTHGVGRRNYYGGTRCFYTSLPGLLGKHFFPHEEKTKGEGAAPHKVRDNVGVQNTFDRAGGRAQPGV